VTKSGVAQSVHRRRHRLAHLLVVALLATTAMTVTSAPAHAAFTSCVYGSSGTGEACLWTNSPYVGNPSLRVKSTATGLSVNAQSFGNRLSNRCAVFYRTNGTVAATAGPDTGNSWSSTQTIGSIDISVC